MLSVIIEVCCQQSEKFLWEARHLFRRRQQQNGDEKTNVVGATFQLGLISVPTNPKVRVRYRAVICPSPWLVTAVFYQGREGSKREDIKDPISTNHTCPPLKLVTSLRFLQYQGLPKCLLRLQSSQRAYSFFWS
ncbi:hypothetical protein CDAR_487641 [Caerostris darwini]|uniref:Uncharacterized protein n=1 Tax=Caerostris darwini TaxID=1538125 RepID=A0AAV4PPU8_9ARAC|nr:hypothetical protein CDAR_487641 [Caerostris darwini]